MASKSAKKKRRSLILLFGCILVCAIGYAALSVYQAEKEKEEEEAQKAEEITLLSFKEGDVSEISFENPSGSMKIKQDGKEWRYAEDAEFPLNQEYAEDMAENAENLTALREVTEEAEDFSDYGLDKPQITAVFTTKEGDQTLYIGEQTPSEDEGYYCYIEGSKAVYEIEESVYTAFAYSKDQMMVLEDAPEITSGQITKLAVKNPKEFDFTAETEAVSENSTWAIKEPYDSPVAGSSSQLTTFLGSYENISYEGAAEYNCKDFSKYGLEEENPKTASILVEYYELVDAEDSEDSSEDSSEDNSEDSSGDSSEDNSGGEDSEESKQEKVNHTLKLVIGKKDSDGNYYARVNDSGYVYLLSETTVDNLIPDKAFTYIEPKLTRVSGDNIKGMTFTADEIEYEITRQVKTTKNEDGEEETETNYFFDNKTMELKDYNAVLAAWTLLEYAKEIPEKKKADIDDELPVLSVRIGNTGMNQEVSFLPYDSSFYAVKDGEQLLFLTDKRGVDGFIEKLKDQAAK